MANETKLGTTPSGGEGRDAVHIAIVAAQAGKELCVGDTVKLRSDGRAVYCAKEKAIGVVDPFLAKNLSAGDWFWLCLNPGSITSLNHVWEHPAFPLTKVTEDQPDQPAPTSKEASEEWLRAYVLEHCPNWAEHGDGGYDLFLQFVREDKWIYYAGSDCHNLGDVEDAAELFKHLSVVLDMRIDASYFEAFTCSC
jgi:hypothetical protein